MKTLISNKLVEIARDADVTLLFACESGSRAWGFPSVDSDYDIRFIYTRKTEHYLSVDNLSEDIKLPIEGDLDVYGWDLRKVLRLLKQSNVTPFEWIQSPIVYYADETFPERFRDLLTNFYYPRKHAHHYLGLVKGKLLQLDAETVNLKSFFYMLRSLLSAQWSLELGHYAPMELMPLLALLPPNLKDEVLTLIALKASADENDSFALPESLKSYIAMEYMALSERAKGAPLKYGDTALLDDYFLKTIRQNDI